MGRSPLLPSVALTTNQFPWRPCAQSSPPNGTLSPTYGPGGHGRMLRNLGCRLGHGRRSGDCHIWTVGWFCCHGYPPQRILFVCSCTHTHTDTHTHTHTHILTD
ncbi:hypothetical protein DPEC_G00193970, partial [Dallia pectoralis]